MLRYVVTESETAGHVALQVWFDTSDIESLADAAESFYTDSPQPLIYEEGKDGEGI